MPPPLLFADETAFLFTPISAAGSGGMHTAAEEGVYTLLGNPALLNSVSELMFFAFSGGVGDFFQDGELDFFPPPTYYSINPVAIGAVSKGVGYGLFIHVYGRHEYADIDINAASGFDWVLVSTEGVKLDLGLSPKVLFRWTSAKTDANMETNTLFGLSLTPGILFSLGNRFSVGISLDDMLSPGYSDEKGLTYDILPPLLNAGIAVGLVSNATLGLTLFADYHLLTDLSKGDTGDFPHQLGGGARAEIRNSVWLSLGVADFLDELVPAAGFGLNLGAIKLDMVYYFDYRAQVGIRIVRD